MRTWGPSSGPGAAAKLPSKMAGSTCLSERLVMYTSPATIYPSGDTGRRVLAGTPLSASTRGGTGSAGSSGRGTALSCLSGAGTSPPSLSSWPWRPSTASRPDSNTGLWPMAMATAAGRRSGGRLSPRFPRRMATASSPWRPRASRADCAVGLAAVTVTSHSTPTDRSSAAAWRRRWGLGLRLMVMDILPLVHRLSHPMGILSTICPLFVDKPIALGGGMGV